MQCRRKPENGATTSHGHRAKNDQPRLRQSKRTPIRDQSGADVEITTGFRCHVSGTGRLELLNVPCQVIEKSGGGGRNRTGVHGFAVGFGDFLSNKSMFQKFVPRFSAVSRHKFVTPKTAVLERRFMSNDRELLEALSDKVRRGEPIGFLQAIAVINYQEQLRAEREANTLLARLRSWGRAAIAKATGGAV